VKRASRKTGLENLKDLGDTFGPMVHAVAENTRALVVLLQEMEQAGDKAKILPE